MVRAVPGSQLPSPSAGLISSKDAGFPIAYADPGSSSGNTQQGEKSMSAWVMGSRKHQDGTRDVTIQFEHDDQTGRLNGWIRCMGKTFIVEGSWVAEGSVPGRAHSVMALMGSDQKAAPTFIVITGSLDGPGSAPTQIVVNMIHVSCHDDHQLGWGGTLKPFPAQELEAGAGGETAAGAG